jgi:glycine hydroxymethyltransferase
MARIVERRDLRVRKRAPPAFEHVRRKRGIAGAPDHAQVHVLQPFAALPQAIDKSVFPGTQGGPLEHVIAAKAVAFGEALTDDFKQYARQVVENAKILAGALVERGFAIVSGGTDTHLMLVDLRPKNLTGKVAEKVLDQAGITVNKNTVPDDPQSPFVTSGIRLGTPALTTRGMGTAEMVRVAELIDRALTKQDEGTLARVRAEVEELSSLFPLYQPKSAAGRRVRRSA